MNLTVSLEGLTLHVQDVERSLEFYTRLPGVTVEVHRPGDFAMLNIGGARLGLLRHNVGAFHVELETEDLDALYNQLKDSGFPVQAPPSAKPWGERDFLVLDPDGNMIEFGGKWEEHGTDTWTPSE
jgi:catechol 2,3-dioxygenase-like lactoylglutathione lyase family enzyme